MTVCGAIEPNASAANAAVCWLHQGHDGPWHEGPAQGPAAAERPGIHRWATVSAGDLDPPLPVPEHLRPLRSPLGPEDLRVAPSTRELRAIAELLDREGLAGYALVTMRDGSPWVEVDVAVPALGEGRDIVRPELRARFELAPAGTYRFALWRYTGKVYRVGADGAVEDDPIW